jgi:hypothetical protein
MNSFTISSVQTNYFIISDGKEKPGDSVKTVSEQDKKLEDTVSPVHDCPLTFLTQW